MAARGTSMVEVPETNYGSEGTPDESQRKSVYVSNLPDDTNKITFWQLFSRFGTILEVNLLPLKNDNTRRAGFIKFKHPESSQEAMREFHQQPPFYLSITYQKKRVTPQRDHERSRNALTGHGDSPDSFISEERQTRRHHNESQLDRGQNSERRFQPFDGRNVRQNLNLMEDFNDTSSNDGRKMRQQHSNRRDQHSKKHKNDGDMRNRSKSLDRGALRRNQGKNSAESESRTDENLMYNRNKATSQRKNSSRTEQKNEEFATSTPVGSNICNSPQSDINSNNATERRISRPPAELFQMKVQHLPAGETVKGYVSHVEGTGEFWVQLDPKLAEQLAKELNEKADSHNSSQNILPGVGGLYIVQCFHDKKWYRGQIIKRYPDKTCDVLYIDYGNIDYNHPRNAIRTLLKPYAAHPALAIKCKPLESIVSNYSNVQDFCFAINDKEVTLKLESLDGDLNIVHVDVPMNKKLTNENNSVTTAAKVTDRDIIDDKSSSVKPLGEISVNTPEQQSATNTSEPQQTNNTSEQQLAINAPKQQPTINNTKQQPTINTPEQQPTVEEEVEISTFKKDKVQKPLSFLFKKAKGEQNSQAASKSEKSSDEQVKNPIGRSTIAELKVGTTFQLCLSISESPDKMWGLVRCNNADTIGILENDFGKYETEDDLINPSIGSLIVAKSKDYGNWGRALLLDTSDEESLVFFVDYCNMEKIALVRQLMPRHSDVPIIGAYCFIEASSLEEKLIPYIESRDNVLDLCVVKKLKKEHLKCIIVDDEGEEIGSAEVISTTLKGLEFVEEYSKDNAPSNTKPNEVPEKVEAKPLKEKTTTVTADLPKLKIDPEGTSVVLTGIIAPNKVIAIPETYLESMQDIYSHLASLSQGNYQPQRKELVCAMYDLDQVWYRAEVLNVTANDATVLFIDYGNEATVDFNSILPIIPEALACPAFVVLTENPDAADCLKEFVNDKITMTVSDESTHPITVKFYNNKMPIC